MPSLANAVEGDAPHLLKVPSGVIIADDLTGAADACVAFVTRGLSGMVLLDQSAAGGVRAPDCPVADVIAISTESRGLPASLAATQAAGAARRYAPWANGEMPSPHGGRSAPAAPWIFKKIDSTLRGPVGAEIGAVMAATAARVALVAPAVPAMHRIVDGGVLKTSGRGVLPDIDVVERLTGEGLAGCVSVAADSVAVALRSGARVLVCDSRDQAALDAIVASVTAAGFDPGSLLWVGAAGLAQALAGHVIGTGGDGTRAGSVPSRAAWSAGGAPTHPVTIAQQQRLADDVPPIAVACIDDTPVIERALLAGLDVSVSMPHDGPSASVARFAELLVARERVAPSACSLVMTGGDTAARLCRALGGTHIVLGGEIAPGIPWGMLSAARASSWPVVLKAGGFGDDDGLLRVRRFLMEHHERS